jgi:hypothetical protein
MDEIRAQRVVAALRSRGVNAHLYQENGLFGVSVSLTEEREKDPDAGGTAGLDPEVTGISIPEQIRLRSLTGALG